MNRIFKYQVEEKPGIDQVVQMPNCHNILDLQIQDGRITFWAEVDDSMVLEDCTFKLYGTGDAIEGAPIYIGTIQIGSYVWHLYETTWV